MDRFDLLVQVEILQLVDVRLALALRVAVEAIESNLLPARILLLRNRLA